MKKKATNSRCTKLREGKVQPRKPRWKQTWCQPLPKSILSPQVQTPSRMGGPAVGAHISQGKTEHQGNLWCREEAREEKERERIAWVSSSEGLRHAVDNHSHKFSLGVGGQLGVHGQSSCEDSSGKLVTPPVLLEYLSSLIIFEKCCSQPRAWK
jgi:hypothetical protein